jgi:high affinity choline transporter 7
MIYTIVAFYAAFFIVGIFAGRGDRYSDNSQLLLANRQLPLWAGTLSLIATWVGGGYINGTAEGVFNPELGFVWTQAPWGFALSLIVGGLVFVQPMRRGGFTTMIDLFEKRFGARVGALLYVPALLSELLWMAAILAALGGTFATVVNIDSTLAIIVSATVVLIYTWVGGLWSVALTDSLQMVCIAFGLLLVLPFALDQADGWNTVWSTYRVSHSDTARILPSVAMCKDGSIWAWSDSALLLILGGIPWQVYFQRVFACPSDKTAVVLSVFAGIGCLMIAIPSAMLGIIGATVDWAAIAPQVPDAQEILPYVLRYLAPPAVATVGLCAVAAAVMSSVDSSILSASSMFAWNICRPALRLSDHNDPLVRLIMRLAMVVVTAIATVMAVSIESVYTLWALSADLVYVILFPQLLVALFDRRTTATGAVAGAVTGLAIRLLTVDWVADRIFGAHAMDHWPVRTLTMLCSLSTIVVVSRAIPSQRFGADQS